MPDIAAEQRNPRNWMERYGALGNTIREYIGPTTPILRETPVPFGERPTIRGGEGAKAGFKFGNTGFGGNTNLQPQVNNQYQTPGVGPAAPLVNNANAEYDRILGIYDNLLNKRPTSTLERPSEMRPDLETYQEDPRLGGAITTLEDLARTGGYSDTDVANLRERGISPIRSVYANQMRELDRSRGLSGGYSPNFGAVSARMARDLSSQMAGQMTNVNADIAEKVAEGRLRAAPTLAENLQRLNQMRGDIETRNTAAKNRAGEFNRDMLLKYNTMKQQEDENLRRYPLDVLGGRVKTMGQRGDEARLLEQLRQQGGQSLIDAYLRALQG